MISHSSFASSPSFCTQHGRIQDETVDEFFKTHKKPTIVAMCGSQRAGSFNKMLHDAAVIAALGKSGAIVKPIDLTSTLNLPLYNPDDEEDANFPPGAKILKDTLVDADGIFLIVASTMASQRRSSTIPSHG